MAPVDRAVADLAARQHGVVGRRQLRALGLGDDAIDHRHAAGRLHRIHRGVYAVGHAVISQEGRWAAAVLAAGDGAVLSHASAGELWELLETAPRRVEVIAPRQVAHPAIRAHLGRLAPDEVSECRGIPVTTVARTLLDLAGELPVHRLERAAEEAERRRLTGGAGLDVLLDRHPGRKGAAALRRIAESGRLDRVTRSDLEARFLSLLDAAGLPKPRVNMRVRAGGRAYELDCAWPHARVAVELDGHAYHSTRAAFERDRARDRALQAAGWRVIRVTWRQLRDEPEAVLADLRRLLAASVWS